MRSTHSSPSLHPCWPSLPAWLWAGLALGLTVLPTLGQSPRVVLTPAAGFTITWNGNNGGFSNPDAGVGPSNNTALASNGTVPFTSSDLGPVLGISYHVAANLNDGLYGNSHSWISANGVGGTSDPNPFAGLRFASSVDISSIAWSRDNGDTTEGGCAGGTCVDRAIGVYTLQFTTLAAPDANTPETGDAATGWATIGTVQYVAGTEDASFTSYLRHRFEVAQGGNPITATGLRIKVSDGWTAIDEIEVNPIPDPIPPISTFIEITSATGYSVAWDRNEGNFSSLGAPAPAPVNDASPARGASAFGSSQLDFGVHFITNVIDGLYGNAHSWIPDFAATPDPAPYIGVRFGGRVLLRSVAWGRDNGDATEAPCGGTCKDRALGVYTLQITTVTNPGPGTPEACGPVPESGWVTVGTLNYKADDLNYFNSYLRHRFDLAQGGAAIPATALRIKVPNNQSCIDEIEVNVNQAVEQNRILITNAPGFAITWDGNNGDFQNPALGAAPPDNRALTNYGTVAFGSSQLDFGVHFIRNVNDGLYGNANSWIPDFAATPDPAPFIGLNFNGTVAITNLAWGRDNGNTATDACGGTCTDRALGLYVFQYTQVASPDLATPETGDAATGWADFGSINYVGEAAPYFTSYLRHRFEMAEAGGPLNATGIRIKVPNNQSCIDEIEVNTAVAAPAPLPAVALTSTTDYAIAWDGNDGHFNNPSADARAPQNAALASIGTVAFGSSQLDFGVHFITNVIDGLYGNSRSWIPDFSASPDPNPYIGLNFGRTVMIENIAWSRDNGNTVEGGCAAGTCTDRALGLYTLQITTVANPGTDTPEVDDPATGWATIGTVEYRRAEPPDFTPYLRHRFDVSASGGPIEATGLRIKVPNNQSCVDEIEVNTATEAPRPVLSIATAGSDVVLSWVYGGGLESAPEVTGPWTCVSDARSPYTVPLSSGSMRYFRVRR